MKSILVIDDDLSLREMMEMMLRAAGHKVSLATDGQEGLDAARQGRFDLIISDIKMPKLSGLDVLKHLRAGGSQTPLILVSAYAKPDTAVEAMQKGAYDFIPKPFKAQDLLAVVDSALAHHDVEQERLAMAEAISHSQKFGRLVGSSPAMLHVYETIRLAAQTSTSILITGESGTGKELVARAVHENSNREGEFVAINCGGIPENLVESELFGHKKGSFTGATSDKLGLVGLADGGTLFLDELGELSLAMQVKLLRVLQEKTYRPVGGEKEMHSDVRVISATNRNLEQEIVAGRFREDLYYRINVINIHLPSLRERPSDIRLLAYFFLEKYRKLQNKDVRKISAYAMDVLSRYHFPGNVRELENIIERSVALEQSNIILPESLRLSDFKRPAASNTAYNSPISAAGANRVGQPYSDSPPPAPVPGYSQISHASPDMSKVMREHDGNILPGLPPGGLDELLATLEGYYLFRALKESNAVRGQAAIMLAISPWRLRARLAAYELSELTPKAFAAINAESFPKPELPDGLAPDWDPQGLTLDSTLLNVERHFIHEALQSTQGNKTEAASLLGLSRRSFQHRLERTGYNSVYPDA